MIVSDLNKKEAKPTLPSELVVVVTLIMVVLIVVVVVIVIHG